MLYTKQPDRWIDWPVAPMFTSDLKHLESKANDAHSLGDFLAGVTVGGCLIFGLVVYWGWL